MWESILPITRNPFLKPPTHTPDHTDLSTPSPLEPDVPSIAVCAPCRERRYQKTGEPQCHARSPAANHISPKRFSLPAVSAFACVRDRAYLASRAAATQIARAMSHGMRDGAPRRFGSCSLHRGAHDVWRVDASQPLDTQDRSNEEDGYSGRRSPSSIPRCGSRSALHAWNTRVVSFDRCNLHPEGELL